MARRGRNLTEGDITTTLVKLALPLMGTSLINMLYNITDIMWLGRLSTKAVAAAGTAGFFTAFAAGLIVIAQTGVSIGVSQAYGREDFREINKYVENGLRLNLIIAVSYVALVLIFKNQLVGFFNIQDGEVVEKTLAYLQIVVVGLLFQFFNPVLSGIFNAMGNSVTPFRVMSIGLIINIILDPLLIFGLGPVPALGIKGAALATVLAQVIVLLMFLYEAYLTPEIFANLSLFKRLDRDYSSRIIKLGTPGFLGSGLRTLIGMVITKILAGWGPVAIAVQSTGVQIESISWMTADGFAMALSAFAGQNYGVKNYDRVRESYKKGLAIVSLVGLMSTILFMVFGEEIFSIFIPGDLEAIGIGRNYLRIIGLSQIFMCMEIASAGIFNGIGKPNISAGLSIVFTSIRIPIGLLLTATALGLNGMWWTISGTSIIKGIIAPIICFNILKDLEKI